MHPLAADGAPAPTWSFDGVRAGAAAMLPVLPGVFVFAAGFGALAAQKGLTLFETLLMSALVFAGVAQFVSMGVWAPAFTPALIMTLVLTITIVNLRMVLMSATLQPWIATAPRLQVYASLFFVTDNSWMVATRYRRDGGSDVGFLFGSGIVMWLVWVPSTGFGQIFGSLLSDPRAFAVDLILPLFLLASLTPLIENVRRSLPWVIAGVTAVLVHHFMPGFLYIVVGALAGAIAAGFLGDD